MSIELDRKASFTSHPQPATVVDEEIFCALTGKPLKRDEAYWAPPLVTARELVTTIVHALMHAPDTLGQLLLGEQPNVPYAQDARDLLARRRSAEQMKLLAMLLLVAALIVAPILFLVMR